MLYVHQLKKNERIDVEEQDHLIFEGNVPESIDFHLHGGP